MVSYTTLYGLFALTSLFLTNALILMARYIRQVAYPPTDQDFEKLLVEKQTAETQLAAEQRTVEGLKANMTKLESELRSKDEELTRLKGA
jgi:hypothetical protein